jgi:hypothetical protein
VGEVDDGVLTFESMSTSAGGVFGEAFNPGEVSFPDWGALELELGCDGGSARWTAREAGFPDGDLALQRLTQPDGLACP